MAAAATRAGETSTTDLPGKQNSLKQLNLTWEKIKNGTKRENKRKRRGRETYRTPDCLLSCSEGAWLLLRLLKQRETLRIYHTAWGLFRFLNPGMPWLCQAWAYKQIFTLNVYMHTFVVPHNSPPTWCWYQIQCLTWIHSTCFHWRSSGFDPEFDS